ncbi:DNA-directed RNA polymerase, alpha subunit, putative [Hepatocystis sp. ex Piliocolobus tephrosceles]|nr:DNA-directed RNA polymerase, alpha subunit, putative [Hepatocystis sp. ex Piliocolobus tephrosceles]
MWLIIIFCWIYIIVPSYKSFKINKFVYTQNKNNILFKTELNGSFLKKNNQANFLLPLRQLKKKNLRVQLGEEKWNTSTNLPDPHIASTKDYKIFQKHNFIKKYVLTKEEIDNYIKQMKECRTSGYEPQFPKNAFRTPDELKNIILDYKYKNNNLKIHNYYYFFLYFLKKISDKTKKGESDNSDSLKKENRLISIENFLFLKKKGFFEGELYTWKNWVLLNRGEWEDDIGYEDKKNITTTTTSNSNSNSNLVDRTDTDFLNDQYDIQTLRPLVEPKMKRMPIEYWGSFRAIDFNVNHYPIYKKLFDFFNKVNISGTDTYKRLFPFLFYPRFSVGRDRGGLGYGDANFFGNYSDIYKKREEKNIGNIKNNNISSDSNDKTNKTYTDINTNLNEHDSEEKQEDIIIHSNIHKESFIDKYDFGPNNIKIEEATDIIKYPQNGRLYQKFYIGPLNITDGHTFGSLLKYVCQTQIYGYAIVAIKIHNMNKDSRIDNVVEDMLEISLNLSEVCIYSKEINIETNVRLIFKGPLMLVAGMIPLPNHLKIVNFEQYICTIQENGYIDISIKVEYGKGHWLTYPKGLYKQELGSDNECGKKREVTEVIKKNYSPITASFSSCRMVRISVHKIATKYWCEDRCEFTDPKQMLVVEIWTDPRMLPKNVLLFGIKNIQKILKKFREMIINDNDFTCKQEEQEMRKILPYIDRYKYLQNKQKMEGGPPLVDIDGMIPTKSDSKQNELLYKQPDDKLNEINFNNPFTQQLIDVDNFPKHSNIQLPLQETPPPFIDTLEWLKKEVQKSKTKKRKSNNNYKSNGQYKNNNSYSKKRTFDYDDFINNRLSDILDEQNNS